MTSEDLLRRYTRLVHASMRRLDALAGRGALVEGGLSLGFGLVGKPLQGLLCSRSGQCRAVERIDVAAVVWERSF